VNPPKLFVLLWHKKLVDVQLIVSVGSGENERLRKVRRIFFEYAVKEVSPRNWRRYALIYESGLEYTQM